MHRLGIAVICVLVLWFLFRPFKVTVYRFHRPSCPYCVRSQSEWNKYEFYCLFSTTRTVNVNLDEPQGARMAKLFGVKTVPTVIAVTADGYVEQYDGERTASGYCDWVCDITA